MKLNPIPLLTACLLACTCISAQEQKNTTENESRYSLQLRNASFIPQKNITKEQLTTLNRKAIRVDKRSYVIVQFETIPTPAQRIQLRESGIELLDYIPNNAYTATVKDSLSINILNQMKVRAVFEPSPVDKMTKELANGIFPSHATKTSGSLNVWVNYPPTFSFDAVGKELRKRNFEIVNSDWQSYQVIELRIATNRLMELAALPCINYVEPAPRPDQSLNNKSTTGSRANVLQSGLPGGRNLHGEGVVIGIGDDADSKHVDFNARLIHRFSLPSIFEFHGIHVTGIAGGGGLIDERFTGYASKATIVYQGFAGILVNAPVYVQDYGMVITNNSYGATLGCPTNGLYTLYSRIMDQQMLQMPNLQHVFSSGNSGGLNCTPYPVGFGTVLGGYQVAKNVITVGNNTELEVIANASSKGPVRDGRIKPEIVAQGNRVRSTTLNNGYTFNTGTSMSSPAIAGGLALLYQRYRQLHGNANPKNGLMKALLVNGAVDAGLPGPDYSYGFGIMDLLRSVKMLESNSYINDSVNAGATKTHNITIPPGSSIAQMKVMLYWNDAPAAVLASHALVNDLDLQVSGPGPTTYNPQKLDTLPTLVANPASTGADHVNNIEQVIINTPVAGTYTFSITGTTIPSTPRYEYFIAFDTIPVSTTITYPIGKERFSEGDSMYISWDAFGNTSNDFTVQYSTNNGSTWTTISSTVAANLRLLKWFVPTAGVDPTIITDQARIKVIHNGTGQESISEPFIVVGVPAFTTSQCDGYITLNWAAITGANDYEVMMLRGDDMISVATTASTSYTIGGLSRDSVYWVTVRSRIGINPGRRAVAVSVQPNGTTCGGTFSDNDLRLAAIVSPASSGRKFTSTELSNSVSIIIRIKNLGNVTTSGNIPVAYKVGASPQVNETIIAPNIAGGATFDYTFATNLDMSAVGSYPIMTSVTYGADGVRINDTISYNFKQLDNAFIDISSSDFVDDIEAAPVQSHKTNQMGLENLDRYDFVTTTSDGRIRTFVNTGIANSGTKALTMDSHRYNLPGTADSLKGTFNLLSYNVLNDDIRLDFVYKQHGGLQQPNAANRVWVRGDDQKPWIELYNLDANKAAPGIFKKTASLEVSDLLSANTQNFSSSFQLRWGQYGPIQTGDNLNSAGFTFDDFHLYIATDDIQMISIDTPVISNCALTATTPIRITVRNSANTTITNIPVYFEADGVVSPMETIFSIAGNTTLTYLFTGTANFSALGPHTLRTWTALGSDSYKDNDTATLELNNSPVVNVFPYLENFESGNGFWHSEGVNSSWEYGTPASVKINGAASGSKAWKTSLVGNYNDLESSYLYSPCFNISGMTTPTLSLSIALDLEDCGAGTLCDAAYVEYSSDGITWTKLGTTGAGTNWYNRNYSGHHVWSILNYTRWHVATIPLPTGLTTLRLRFSMQADPFVTYEGIAIDDIHIYDNIYGIFTGPGNPGPVINQPSVNGSSWIDFTDNSKLVASINPNGQNLGSTDVQAYLHAGAVRFDYRQYYANRNITIKPTNRNLADSATVRFYFLDTESEAVLNATGCGICTKPTSAYRFGVSKFSHTTTSFENGTIADNQGGDWLFVPPAEAVKVPFDRGYYVEFKVKDFSEFWLNNGGLNNSLTLPVELVSFSATRQANKDVLVEWTTESENNVERYEIEVARNNDEFRQNQYSKIGEVNSKGNSAATQQYNFIDKENGKTGVRYYRLKIIDNDSRSTYSAIRPVVFNEEIEWQVYPNPFTGKFQVVYQVDNRQPVTIKVFDVNGKIVVQKTQTGNGFLQKEEIDMRAPRFSTGLYLVEIIAGGKTRTFRLIKQ